MKRLLPLIFLVFASCSENDETEEIVNHDWDTSFYAPRIGEKFIYRDTTKSVSSDQSKPVSPEDIEELIAERIQIYDGPETIEGKTFHKYSIVKNGVVTDGFLFDWDGKMLTIVGSVPAGKQPEISENPIPIAQLDAVIGTYWHWPKSSPFGSGSRVIAFEDVKVPAGTFSAYKISIKKTLSGIINIREYWFVPKTGIVKEKSRIYSGGLLRAQSTIELVDQVNPGQEPSENAE